ncbi:MAG: penicillin-insensitive murein endopeptidase [Myxococcota bacterium]
MRGWALGAAMMVSCAEPRTAEPPAAPSPPAAAAEPETPTPPPTPGGSADASAPEAPADVGHSPAAPVEPSVLELPASHSTSLGSPTAGRLEGGVALPLDAPGLLRLPNKDPESRYGTVELVQALVRAAATVEHDDPGAPVSIGDLSRPQGGDIRGHASHRSGRDVDVLFYLLHDDDTPFVPAKFIPLDPEGRGTDYGDLSDPSDDVPVHVDVPRTWRFVAALLADEAAAVQRILIVEHLRSALLAEAKRQEAPASIVQRFAEVTCQPRFPHDDHMHIRVFCSAEDIRAGCEDPKPRFPWRVSALAAEGVEMLAPGTGKAMESPTAPAEKSKSKLKLKTIEQARAEAGPMHEDVVEFLDRREAWARKPHPGRRWCR